jgi:hypothetical protein
LLAAETADVDPKTSKAARATLASGSMRVLRFSSLFGGKTVTLRLNSLPTFPADERGQLLIAENSRSFVLLVLSSTL